MAPLYTFIVALAIIIVGTEIAFRLFENNDLNMRVHKLLDTNIKIAEDYRELAGWYEELSEKYHELCVAYTRAYAILEEHDLLPKEEE